MNWRVIMGVLGLATSPAPGVSGQDSSVPVVSQAPSTGSGQARFDWGILSQPTNDLGCLRVELSAWTGSLQLPTPASNVVSAVLLDGRRREPIFWTFSADATRLQVERPDQPQARKPSAVLLETAGRSGQFPDGRIVFSALDAVVQGTKAKLESQPGNHRIGFWTAPSDTVRWDYRPTRWGRYDIELCYSADGGDGTELEVEIAGQRLMATRPSTGSWYRYATLTVGRVYIGKAEPFTVRVGCKTLKGVAVMNLKALILRPAPEGEPIAQEESGEITLLARDAITRSTVMRYEPATNKNCLGFWVNPRDWAEWEFTVIKPGKFTVDVWQGCGKGQGGSEVAVEAGSKRLVWTVEDTGHFQNFVPVRIGEVTLGAAGPATLAVRPVRKRAAAVMDVRQIRLVPSGTKGDGNR